MNTLRTGTHMIRGDRAFLAIPTIASGARAPAIGSSPVVLLFWTDPRSLGGFVRSSADHALLLIWFIAAYVLLVLRGASSPLSRWDGRRRRWTVTIQRCATGPPSPGGGSGGSPSGA